MKEGKAENLEAFLPKEKSFEFGWVKDKSQLDGPIVCGTTASQVAL